MSTTSSRHASSDRKRVSGQSHEVKYTGRKVARKAGVSAKRGQAAVQRAKRQTGTVSRGKVERRAQRLA